jgi:protein-tyrosine phosphatase
MDDPSAPEPYRILFVCLGNICRSPTAEAVMLARIAEAGLSDQIVVDSAGTGDWHVGKPPDERAMAEATSRGIEMTSRGRQVHPGDLYEHDLVLAMDQRNLTDLYDLAPADELRSKIHLLRSFDPAMSGATRIEELDVPDPYHQGPEGFAVVFDLVDAACRGVLDHVRGELAARSA